MADKDTTDLGKIYGIKFSSTESDSTARAKDSTALTAEMDSTRTKAKVPKKKGESVKDYMKRRKAKLAKEIKKKPLKDRMKDAFSELE